MKKKYYILGVLHIFIAAGAIPAGILFIADKSGALLGMSVDMIAPSPFNSYLIPGVFLLAVNGAGNAAGAVLAFRINRYAGFAGVVLGTVLCVWIVFQLFWITEPSFLQPLLFITGLAVTLTGYLIMKSKTGGHS